MTIKIDQLLGNEADNLLNHKCATIAREDIHIPGPDFVSRIMIPSDRPVAVLRNLQTMFNTGRLGGTGYLSILPVDQGIRTLGRSLLCAESDLLRSREYRQAGH